MKLYSHKDLSRLKGIRPMKVQAKIWKTKENDIKSITFVPTTICKTKKAKGYS